MDSLESQLLEQVSADRLMAAATRVASGVRLSGSADERAAFEYVQRQLDEFGLTTTWLEHPAYVSYPLESRLELLSDGPARELHCLSHAFGASVDQLEAEVVDVGAGSASDLAAQDLLGKIALIDGLATPVAVYRAEQAGCAGLVFVNDDHLHNMIVTTVWGTPTPESAQRIPRVPVVSIVQSDAQALRALAAGGTVRARMHTRVFTGWQTTPIVVGELPGRTSRDFVLFSGHLDSWAYGAMDNASANAVMLEVGRLLAQHRDDLVRGLRIAFWSGHSHGRYSGSTWYADNHWEELYDRCVAHVNIDSTGARGATFYGSFPSHAELSQLGARVIEEQTRVSARRYRMTRAGDMSFNGIGIPALFMELSQVPVAENGARPITMDPDESTGGEMPWWWHTSEDTIDKIDSQILTTDARVYLSALWRLCSSPVYPMDFRPVVEELAAAVSGVRRELGEQLDLANVDKRVGALRERVDDLAGRAARAADDAEIGRLNAQMKMLSRILIPLTYTEAGPFDHDPAWSIPFLPGLQGARRLGELQSGGDEFQFLKTQMVRKRNEVEFALRRAMEVLSASGR